MILRDLFNAAILGRIALFGNDKDEDGKLEEKRLWNGNLSDIPERYHGRTMLEMWPAFQQSADGVISGTICILLADKEA